MNIDQELRAALDVNPSPDFVARVRTRIAAEPEVAPWNWWAVAGASAAAAAVLLVLLVPPLTRVDHAPAVLIARSVAPTAELLPALGPMLPAVDVPAAAETPGHVAAAHLPRDEGVRLVIARNDLPRIAVATDTVVLDSRETAALRRLVFGRALSIEKPYVGPSTEAIEIAQIVIDPLPTGSEGVRQ